MFHFLPHRKH